MKKTIITALIALLIMLAVTACDSIITEPETNKAEYTADGRKLVTVEIKTSEIEGNSRSLTDHLAKTTANFVEVVFKEGTNYYPASGYYGVGSTLSVQLPLDSEYTVDDAILLIGKRDKTLMATGKLKLKLDVNNDPIPLKVGTDMDPIEFTVTSLVAYLNAKDTDPPLDGYKNSFVITDNSLGDFQGNTRNGSLNGLPCFQVPTKTSDIVATLTIDGLDENGDKIIAVDSTKVTGKPTLVTINPINDSTPLAKPTIISPVANDKMDSGEISFKFNTKNAVGAYRIVFNIPVVGFGTNDPKTYSDNRIWFIRGGTTSGSDFDGTSDGGVVLSVAASPAGGGGTVIIDIP